MAEILDASGKVVALETHKKYVAKSGSGGPEDPMIEQRVAKLESDMQEMKASLKIIEAAVGEIKHLPKMNDYVSLQKDFGSLKSDVSELKGKLSNLPTWWMLMLAILATWGAGAGIVYALT
jgi:hypothetical protein